MKPRNIYTRIEKLEAELSRDPIKCLCITPDGEEKILSVSEMLATGAGFIKVVSGSDPDDLFMMLQAVKRPVGFAVSHLRQDVGDVGLVEG